MMLLIATVFRGQALHLITELRFAPDFMCDFRKWNKIFRKVVTNLRAMYLYNLELLKEYDLHLSLMFSTVFINRHFWCGTYSHSNLRDKFSSGIVTISAAEGDVKTVKSLATLNFFLGHTKESNHSGCQNLRKETKESSRDSWGSTQVSGQGKYRRDLALHQVLVKHLNSYMYPQSTPSRVLISLDCPTITALIYNDHEMPTATYLHPVEIIQWAKCPAEQSTFLFRN